MILDWTLYGYHIVNNVADIISKMIDYDDYSVQDTFYQYMQQISGFIPKFDHLQNLECNMCTV